MKTFKACNALRNNIKRPISVVMWRSTLRLRSLYQKNLKHLTLKRCISFAKSTWFMTSEASFTWTPRDCFRSASNEVNLSAVSFTLYYIIMRYNCFIFIIIYILRSNELCPWNNSRRTEAELTLTDHRFHSWVYVWFIWIIFVAVHRCKWMTLTMFIIFIQ